MSDKPLEIEIELPDESQPKVKPFEFTPPVTPDTYKVSVIPSSPTSNKLSPNNEGSGLSTSQGSLRTKLLEPSLTPSDGAGGSRFLYIREKLRRPSLLSECGNKTPKDGKATNQRIGNLKKDTNPFAIGEQFPPSVPPNTPSPSGWRNFSATELFESKSDDFLNESSILGSDISSQVTTKALASESESTWKTDGTSSETLPKLEKPSRPAMVIDNNNTANSINWSDHLNYLKATKSGHTGLRSVGSASFIKSFWGQRNPKTVHHCFMSDITDVRQMEHALLQLLEDFHSGKLRAFTKDCSMEQMQGIREQQERLARLHFDLGAQQDHFAPLSEEGLRANQENMQKLMGSLEQLSLSIEKLQLFSKDVGQ